MLNRIEAGQVQEYEVLDRAMQDMITWSSNTATNYIIHLITETTGDTLLDRTEFQIWHDCREALNRFFRGFGWLNLRAATSCKS